MDKPTNNSQPARQTSNGLIPMLQQLGRWPLAALGATAAAAYLLGRRQRRSVATGNSSGLQVSQDTISPASDDRTFVTSEAPNASFAAGAGEAALGFDSPPITSSYLSNTDVDGPDQGRPYFPPGGAPDRDRDGSQEGGDS